MLDLPNLFIPGAMKSGTSSLWRYLHLHPDICMSSIKEPGFWVDDKQYPDFNSYRTLFKNGIQQQYWGDASTSYMVFDSFIERISQYVPDAKFIFILRNPVDRAWSHYWFLKGIGYEKLLFKDAFTKHLGEQPEYPRLAVTQESACYHSFGLYGKWLTRFFKQFDQNNILILETNELKSDPLKTVNACFDFLKLPLLESIQEQNLNQTVILDNPEAFYKKLNFLYGDNLFKALFKKLIPKKLGQNIRKEFSKKLLVSNKTNTSYPIMSDEERAWTAMHFQEDMALLKEITGKPFSAWIDFQTNPEQTNNHLLY